MVRDIRKVYEQLNLTRNEVSNEFNIPIRTLKSWERGERNPPEWVWWFFDKLINYCSLYGRHWTGFGYDTPQYDKKKQ